MDAFAKIPKPEQEFLMWKGIALDCVQTAESMFSTVLKIAFHSHPTITIGSLEAEETSLRRKTLGQLMRELDKRADIHPQLEQIFDAFLGTRNQFIHHLRVVADREGEDAAILLTKRVIVEGYRVIRALGAIIAFWYQRMETLVDGLEPLHEMRHPDLDDMEAIVPKVPYIIRPRRSSP